ncbi:MAG TPA: flagellar motor protein MotB [Vicinamibacterales bacterium]|nr:flagellar motor protein MotB [Vicinamibacterales bacterium]
MKNVPPIIVKARKKGHAAHHGGAWKVAYADFVTALMAFFLVMWLVGQDKSVRTAVGAYFRDPGAFADGRGASILEGYSGVHPDEGTSSPSQSRGHQDQQALEHLADQIRETLRTMPDFAAVRDQIEIRMTADGLRIELQESAAACFFDTGSATMTPQAEHLFGAIGRELAKLTNGVMVEGHTDARQYASRQGYTNWELSADRANAVRRVMERSGLREQQLREVRGYADKQLRNADDPLDVRNRRVSILVRRADEHAPGAREAAAGGSTPTP